MARKQDRSHARSSERLCAEPKVNNVGATYCRYNYSIAAFSF